MECLIDNGPFGTKINLGDESHELIVFDGDFTFPFYGVNYDRVYVNSNGNLTFNGFVTDYDSNVLEFKSGLPRIAPFWVDLDPSDAPTSSGVFYKQLSDRFIVTWIQEPFWSVSGIPPYNTFQVVLYDTGRVGFAYNNLENTTLITYFKNVLVGVAAGSDGDCCIFRYFPPENYDPITDIHGPYGKLDGKQLFFNFNESGCTRSVGECPSRGFLFEIV